MEWTDEQKFLLRTVIDSEIDRLRKKIVAIDERWGSHHRAWDTMIADLESMLNDLGGTTWVVLKEPYAKGGE